MPLPEGFKLFGRNFIVNIAIPENSPSGLFVVNQDPRKFRIKPAAYAGTVEEVGGGCTLVKPGDKIVVERWMYTQMDVDDERIIAREDEILICADDIPAPGVIVLRLIEEAAPKIAELALPDTAHAPKKNYYLGQVEKTASWIASEDELLWLEKHDSGQFVYGGGRLAFRVGSGADVLMKMRNPKEQEAAGNYFVLLDDGRVMSQSYYEKNIAKKEAVES